MPTCAMRSTAASWLSRSLAISRVSFRRAFCSSSSACFRSLEKIRRDRRHVEAFGCVTGAQCPVDTIEARTGEPTRRTRNATTHTTPS